MTIVKVIVLEPHNPDGKSLDPHGPFINADFMEEVETGIFGPFNDDESALDWIHQLRRRDGWEKCRFVVTQVDSPLPV